MPTEKITFANSTGQALAGILELPATGSPKAFAILSHCFTCSKDYKGIRSISQVMAEMGFGVLAFDFTGLGDSGGEFAETSFSTNIADLISASDYLDEHYSAPAVLVGHSLGGAAAIEAAGQLPAVKAVAVIGTPADPRNLRRVFENKLEEIYRTGKAEVSIAGRPFTIGRRFVEDLEATSLTKTIAALNKPIIVFHSPADKTVDLSNATKIFVTATHPKSFISLGDADHLMSNRKDAEFVGRIIASWAEHYL